MKEYLSPKNIRIDYVSNDEAREDCMKDIK